MAIPDNTFINYGRRCFGFPEEKVFPPYDPRLDVDKYPFAAKEHFHKLSEIVDYKPEQVWYYGELNPVPTEGNDGCFYLNLTTGDLFVKEEGRWVTAFNMKPNMAEFQQELDKKEDWTQNKLIVLNDNYAKDYDKYPSAGAVYEFVVSQDSLIYQHIQTQEDAQNQTIGTVEVQLALLKERVEDLEEALVGVEATLAQI